MKKIALLLLFSASAFAQQVSFFFDFGQDVPNEDSKSMLEKWRSENPDIEILSVSGYCDSVDTDAFNKELSLRRIRSVMALLHARPEELRNTEFLAMGEEAPQRPPAADNRRVDIRYRGKAKVPETADMSPRENQKSPEFPESAEEKSLPDTPVAGKFENAKPGDVIRIRNINFYLNSEVVVPESLPRLGELLQVMLDRPSLRIEIHGHICCNPNPNDTKLSYRRAKYIFTYLLNHGISLDRLGYKGFGSADPIYRIPEKSWEEEAANRRVEILVKAI